MYINELKLPSKEKEYYWLYGGNKNYKTDSTKKAGLKGVDLTHYPFHIFTRYASAPDIEFAPITIFYGGNGSGKSTLLNVIAEKMRLYRNSPFNTTPFFKDYCDLCEIELGEISRESKIITSDDIFEKLHFTREVNSMIDGSHKSAWDNKRKLLAELGDDPELLRLKGKEDYKRFKEYYDVVSSSTSEFIMERTRKNLEAHSNGETALGYICSELGDNSLLLLDEPENSLSPAFQKELKKIIEDHARFFGCQFVIATHSPLLLSMDNATVFDLDNECEMANWYELENIKIYASLFLENKDKF